MPRSFTQAIRQAARRRATAVAAAVADRVLRQASSWAERLSDLAQSARPALDAAADPEIEVSFRPVAYPPPQQTAPPDPPTEPVFGDGSPTASRSAADSVERPQSAQPPQAAEPPPRARSAAGAPADDGLLGWRVAVHLREQLERRKALILESHPFGSSGQSDEADPLLVHDMRVASRRLRAFLELFGPRLPNKPAARLRRALRRITRGLGELREIDAFVELLMARMQRVTQPHSQAALEHVLAMAEDGRDQARARARKTLAKLDREELGAQIDTVLERIVPLLVASDAEVAELLDGLLQARLRTAWAKAPVPPPPDAAPEAVHEVRIQAKRLRYAFELVDPAFADGKRLRRRLKRVQRSIGTARDLDQLLERLRERAEGLNAQGLRTLAGGLRPVIDDLESERAQLENAIQVALTQLDPHRLHADVRAELGLESREAEGANGSADI